MLHLVNVCCRTNYGEEPEASLPTACEHCQNLPLTTLPLVGLLRALS